MAASKKKIVETFTKVSGIGEAYAEQLHDELGLRSLDDLVKAAEAGKIRALKGIGPAKERSILSSAKELLSTSPQTDSPATKPKKAGAKKAGAKKAGAKKAGAKKADAKKADAKKADAKKAGAKKAGAKKADAKKSKKTAKPAPEATAKKDAAKKDAPKKEEPQKETPKRAPRSSASDFEDRARKSSGSREGSKGKRPTIPGLLFKIGKKLVSRLLN